jgi:nicotinamide-nucleotide amidase
MLSAIVAVASLGSSLAFAQEPTRYMVVVTGGEILDGAFADGHTHFLTRTLKPLGLRCVGSMTVNDGKDDIQAALGFATKRAELVIMTGGLGPTDNDMTCDAISEFTGVPVEEHPEVLAAMARRFRTPVQGIRANLRRQTRVPVVGSYLENAHGSAVGLVFEYGKVVIVAMPGPPRELQPMVSSQLIPLLSRRFGTRLPGSSLTVRFVGLGQSSIDQTMEQYIPLPDDVTVSSQFEGSRVDFTFTLPDDNGENRSRLDRLKQLLLKHLGKNIYATDANTSLEEVVVGMMAEQGITLSIAEIASGGSVAAAVTGAERSEEVLAGSYFAPDEETLRRLLLVSSKQGAELIAKTLCETTRSEWALVVGESQDRDGGSRYADVLIRVTDDKTVAQRVAVRGNDSASRFRLTTQIVDQLRKQLVR